MRSANDNTTTARRAENPFFDSLGRTGSKWSCLSWMIMVWLLGARQGVAAPESAPLRSESIMAELGCVQCHNDLPGRSLIREQAPEFSQAGLRYRTGYLFDYLLRPRQVRRHLGRARMPDFQLSEKEALALALFLEMQQSPPASGGQPPWPEIVRRLTEAPPAAVSRDEFERELTGGLACLTCHTISGRGGIIAPELIEAGHQLQPGWVAAYLVAPERFGVSAAVMPAQFYQISADRKRYEPIVAEADRKVAAVVGFLASAGMPRADELDRNLARARAAHPGVTPGQGREVFRALNCVACHRHAGSSLRTNAAPALAAEAQRVQRSWLEAYLTAPGALRRAGFHPGDGSRMPDFRLTKDEARAVAETLGGNEVKHGLDKHRPLSVFAQAKVRTLLREKLSCLGCHRLDGQGGVIGPDLGGVSTRLQPDYVQAIIRDPRRIAPHSIMPMIPLPPETTDLIARYLIHRKPMPGMAGDGGKYLSLLDHAELLGMSSQVSGTAALEPVKGGYVRQCAPCHGVDGRGDGFNAAFLFPIKPAAFTNGASLSRRPDDTLFDGVHAGGAILNRSHLMPPWGATIPAAEVRALVRHLRVLCQCEGPAWSRE